MERRLAAILIADVVDYSLLMGEDEARMLAALAELRRELFEPVVASCSGRVVKRMGDGWIVEYPNVSDAVASAVEVQESLNKHEFIRMRVGIHSGDVTFQDDDVYGDGINVAARLEAMAVPGQVLISDTAHHSLDGKSAEKFGGGEQHQLKNIARPVAVWRWPYSENKDVSDALTTERPLSEKPSIAVLPFDNMSNDPEQEYFSDGITEDIITELSRNRWITVIARNTTFTYKNTAVNIAAVARELGVRYVLEGSVRKASDKMRINVQLIDGASGNHVWAERYDRKVIDIFDLQDEITRNIAAAIEPEIFAVEGHNASRRNAADLSVWEDMMRAQVFFARTTVTDTNEAIRLLNDIISHHSEIPLAFSQLSFMYLFSVHMGWLPPDPYKNDAELLARKAVQLDEQDHWGHVALGYVRMMERSTDAAVSELTRALYLNPNSATAYGYRALVNAFGARAEAAMKDVDQAIRLSPRDPQLPLFLSAKAVALFHQRNFQETLQTCNQVLEMRPEYIGALRLKSSTLAHTGEIEEAQRVLQKVLELQPETSLSALEQAQPYATEEGLRFFLEGLKLAGLS